MRDVQYIITKHLSVTRGALFYMITDNGFFVLVLKQELEQSVIRKTGQKNNSELFLHSVLHKFPHEFCKAGCDRVYRYISAEVFH